MPKFSVEAMVVWRDGFGFSRSQILNVEVVAGSESVARTKAYAEGQEWLKMVEEPGGCEVRSLTKAKK